MLVLSNNLSFHTNVKMTFTLWNRFPTKLSLTRKENKFLIWPDICCQISWFLHDSDARSYGVFRSPPKPYQHQYGLNSFISLLVPAEADWNLCRRLSKILNLLPSHLQGTTLTGWYVTSATRPGSAWFTDIQTYCMGVSVCVCVFVLHSAGGPPLVGNLHYKNRTPPTGPPAVPFGGWIYTALLDCSTEQPPI